MFSINQPLFLQENQPLKSRSQIFIWDWGLNLGRKELGFFENEKKLFYIKPPLGCTVHRDIFY